MSVSLPTSCNSSDRFWSWPLLVLLGMSSALGGCGSDEPPPARPQPRGESQSMYYPAAPGYQQPYAQPVMPQPQWGRSNQRAPMAGAGWPQTAGPAQQQVPTMSYPPAQNPWQRPPNGFGAAIQMPQMTWQSQQAMPQFRPLEQDKSKEYSSTNMQAVAPYDRPIGSSHDRQQPPSWPGYYPGGTGYPAYPAYPGYPGYPGAGPGYPGAPVAPWGMPGVSGPWPTW